MNMLVEFDRASSALSNALNSKQVSIVLKSRADLEMIKLRARQVRDRQLLADATEFQMKVERWLGKLLIEAEQGGILSPRGRPGKSQKMATLKEIGVDKKLSMTARRSAALPDQLFAQAISDMREKLAAGNAKVVSVVDDLQSVARKRSDNGQDRRFGLKLLDRARLGQVKVGRLRSRIADALAEAKMLELIYRHIGPNADPLATVEESISSAALGLIINVAKDVGGKTEQ